MNELFHRFFHKPVLAMEILAATFFISILALSMPLYVIQLLNRYISYGFHGTLVTLTSGILLAIVLQFCFRMIRTKLAAAVNQEANEQLSREIHTIVGQAKAEPLEHFSKSRLQEAVNNVQTVQNTYDAQNLNAVLDAPFSIIFIAVIYLLSPVLAAITVICILISLLFGWLAIRRAQQNADRLLKASAEHRSLNFSAINSLDTVRIFRAASFLFNKWKDQLKEITRFRMNQMDKKELSQTMTMSGSMLTSVFIYAVGAALAARGELSVGALIGTNILATRAYQNTTRLVQVSFMLNKAKQAFSDIALLKRFPLEASSGSALRTYKGKIEFQDLGFSYPQTKMPVFESVNLQLNPGQVLAVSGENGTGKTTMAKILTCILESKRGSILVDGVNLLQTAPSWWRKQLIYMPQEPGFLKGTLRENILFLNPDLDESRLNEILRATDLRHFLDRTPNGLDTPMTENEKNFPLGIRRRLSLARALASDGQLVILDEPTDTLDQKGVDAVYTIMNTLARAKKTIIVFSNDPKILKGASVILDLNAKPVPEVIHSAPSGKSGADLS